MFIVVSYGLLNADELMLVGPCLADQVILGSLALVIIVTVLRLCLLSLFMCGIPVFFFYPHKQKGQEVRLCQV